MEKERYHIVVEGRVQGVGFRFFVHSIAIRYDLTGWVRNLYDGTVEMEVQGSTLGIEKFISDVKQGNRFVRVDELTMDEIPIKEESDFRVIY